jgi:5'-3' exonuclease
MGVPGFFAWVMKRCKRNIMKSPNKPYCLYIDANCLIHPQCFKVLKDNSDSPILEDLMIDRILKYLDYLEDYVKPTDYMYIAIDGVAPLAKMEQQRKRRFKSVQDTSSKDLIRIKYGVKLEGSWSNISISPGTKFMEKLHLMLKHHYTHRTNINYIYSSYHTDGEGEHKILQHIRNTNLINKEIVIYGLDADLIFLSLASQKQNIFLLRESAQFNNKENKDSDDKIEEELSYVSIDETNNAFDEIMDKKNIRNDFIFLCFFIGNDFLPHLPSVNIKCNGMEILLETYFFVRGKVAGNLILDDFTINDNFLQLILCQLRKKEEDFLLYDVDRIYHKKKCFANDPCERELWYFDNDIKQVELHLGSGSESEWKKRYYNYFYKTDELNELIKDMVNQYLKGVKWVCEYYFNKCSDWRWSYPYNIAPFVSDIAFYYTSSKKIQITENKSVNIMEQLLTILPPQCDYLLPESYRYLVYDPNSPIIDLYPIKTLYNTLYKTERWQCEPLLPKLDIKRIIKACKVLKLSSEEKTRNRKLPEFIY